MINTVNDTSASNTSLRKLVEQVYDPANELTISLVCDIVEYLRCGVWLELKDQLQVTIFKSMIAYVKDPNKRGLASPFEMALYYGGPKEERTTGLNDYSTIAYAVHKEQLSDYDRLEINTKLYSELTDVLNSKKSKDEVYVKAAPGTRVKDVLHLLPMHDLYSVKYWSEVLFFGNYRDIYKDEIDWITKDDETKLNR